MIWCRECSKYHAEGRHLPQWEVWDADPQMGEEREDCRLIRAADEQEAAEKWAEEDDCDSAEYSIVGGTPALVYVARPGHEPVRWQVEGETVPSYSATRANGEEIVNG